MRVMIRAICGATLVFAASAAPVQAPIPGSGSAKGCGDGLWKDVYNPGRLLIVRDCVTITGTVVDATADQSRQRSDGVRHEPDGDTHGWLRVDSQFQHLIDAGDMKHERGNLVFEIICHYRVIQVDAQSSCRGFKDQTAVPAIGMHVAITGTLVHDNQHGWNEIHPVSKIEAW